MRVVTLSDEPASGPSMLSAQVSQLQAPGEGSFSLSLKLKGRIYGGLEDFARFRPFSTHQDRSHCCQCFSGLTAEEVIGIEYGDPGAEGVSRFSFSPWRRRAHIRGNNMKDVG